MPSISPAFVYLEQLGANYEALVSGNEEPFDGEAIMLKAIYLAAHEQGRRVLLDGAGGDVVLSEGSYIVRLIQQGQLGLAIREICAENRLWRDSPFGPNLLQYAAAALSPEVVRRWARGPRRRRQVRRYVEESLILPDFARRVGISEHFDRMWQTFPAGRSTDYATERCDVIRPSVTAGRERYARIAAANQIEARDPFLDKRVVDYCAFLPGRLRLRDGWPKIVLRELMVNRVPEEVRWLRGKPHLGWLFNAALVREGVYRGEIRLAGLQDALQGYVNPDALDDAWAAFHAGGAAGAVHSANVLSVWLRENAERPVVQDRLFG